MTLPMVPGRGRSAPLPLVSSPRSAKLRKRGEQRVDRFVEAATAIFLEKGYRRARLSDIVRRAGGSLSTLYDTFGNKEGLAHAIIERQADRFTLVFHDVCLTTLPADEGLHRLAKHFVEAMVSPESQVLHRLIVGEGPAFPALRDWYFDHAVVPNNQLLAGYLRHHRDSGALVLPQGADVAAQQLGMLMTGDLVLRMSSGHSLLPDTDAAVKLALAGVDTFLNGALPR
ncbi:TetR/AcrR family transcriptional regulator [Novilysobacter antarcticus]|uniref:TetR/AcrR family transcriptional regulator n=1 Tax=Novilysobacter antarcticus TaxID=2862543 RepID=UPI001C99F572|nr:TetR/AcrR family transcriptional regulator [Lysobacter antarcticus]